MKLRLTLLLVGLATVAAALDGMVAATFQNASMDWWYAVPQGFTPKVNPVNSAFQGEYFRIVSFYKDYALDTNSHARITFDFALIRPDGTIDDSAKGVVAHDGPATHPLLLPAEGVLNVCFDEGDPLGEHRIRITSVDHVAGVTNIQTAAISHVKFEMPTLDADAAESIFQRYLTAPRPAEALAAFLQLDHSYFNEENEPIWSAIWFFKTVFEHNEYLVPHLMKAFHMGTNKQQRDTILVLALLDELDRLPKMSTDLKAFRRVMKGGRAPDPYGELKSAHQLDMLWGEFFATGTVRPVEYIARSLSLVEHAGVLEKIKAKELDPTDPEVYRRGMLEATFQSALWSIRSNCERSPLLFQYLVGILNSGDLDERAASTLALLLKSIQENETKEGQP